MIWHKHKARMYIKSKGVAIISILINLLAWPFSPHNFIQIMKFLVRSSYTNLIILNKIYKGCATVGHLAYPLMNNLGEIPISTCIRFPFFQSSDVIPVMETLIQIQYTTFKRLWVQVRSSGHGISSKQYQLTDLSFAASSSSIQVPGQDDELQGTTFLLPTLQSPLNKSNTLH